MAKVTRNKTKKRIVLITAASLIAMGSVWGALTSTFSQPNANLPSIKNIKASTDLLNLETSYTSLIGNDNSFQTRLIYNGKPNYVVLDESLTDDMKMCVRSVFEEINYIFSKINPNYTFVVTENPTFLQSINCNTLHVKLGKETESYDGVVYYAPLPTSKGFRTSFCSMNLSPSEDYSTPSSSGAILIAHESGHYLGLGDAYNSSLFADSAMHFSYMGERYYSTNDVLLLASIYSKIEGESQANEIVDFACEYTGDDPQYYYANQTISTPRKPVSFWDIAFQDEFTK